MRRLEGRWKVPALLVGRLPYIMHGFEREVTGRLSLDPSGWKPSGKRVKRGIARARKTSQRGFEWCSEYTSQTRDTIRFVPSQGL